MQRLLTCAVAVAVLAVAGTCQAGLAYSDPAGGWAYTFNGDAALAGPADSFDSLDGTWDHDNGSDQWDGTAIGVGRPGGASAITEGVSIPGDLTYLRLQDNGDARDYGMGDPGSNRKVMFGHSITNDVGAAGDTILDDGLTLSFRARVATGGALDDLHPDGGGGVVPWPAGGDGYVIHDGGKGNISIRQPGGDKIVSFGLALGSDDDELSTDGLVMNKLNGAAPSGDVDLQGDEPGTVNILPLDTAEWHEYWITIEADNSGTGTHVVKVYTDGSLTPNEFVVTAGTGNDYDDAYLALGLGATPQSGAIDVDFLSYATGVTAPVPEPTALVLLASGALALLLRFWKRRRAA